MVEKKMIQIKCPGDRPKSDTNHKILNDNKRNDDNDDDINSTEQYQREYP